MERRHELRLEQMLAQSEIPPDLMRGLIDRLGAFAEPFAGSLERPEQRRHAAEYITGLLSKLPRKSREAIAYLHDRQRQGLQDFVGSVPWGHKLLLATPARQASKDLGEPDAVIVFDPSAFAEKGTRSAGAARQWCGRHGEAEDCQVGACMAYVSKKGHALVDTRLYLPEKWTEDKERRAGAGVPKEVELRTRHQLALEMLDESGPSLPHSWAAGGDETGRPSGFRRKLRGRGERYLLAVPSDTLVRDLDRPPPECSGRGRYPKSPFLRLDRWLAALAKDAWTSIEVRDGEEVPLVVGGGEASGSGEDRDRRHGPRRVAAHDARGPIRRPVQARRLSVGRRARGDVGGIGEGIQGGAPGGRVLPAGQERGGSGRLPGEELGGWHHHRALSLPAAWSPNPEPRRGESGPRR